MTTSAGRNVLVLVVAASIAACSGGGADHGLAKSTLIHRADAICAETNRKVGPLFGQLFPNGDETPPAATAAPVMRTIGADLTASYDDLRRLEPLDADAQAYADVLDRFHAAVRAFVTSARLAKTGDASGYLKQVQVGNDAFEHMAPAARAFGFSTCGQA